MSTQIKCIVDTHNPDIIVCEEIETRGLQGVKSIKSLAALHGMLMYVILPYIDRLQFVAPTTWRSKIKLKKDGDWKQSAVKKVNQLLNLNLNDSDHDKAEAILIGYSLIN
jgi:Holliday junction resolvasome RuvABC endonuclease subunit